MAQPTSVSTIRLAFVSDAFDVINGQVVVFPAKPSEEMMAQIREGKLQLTPVIFVGNVAFGVPIYGPGGYTGALGNLNLRAKQEDRQWAAAQLALPEFVISQSDIEKGECRVVLSAAGTLKVTVIDNDGRTASGRKVCVMEPGRSFCSETDSNGVCAFQLAVGKYMLTVTDGEWRGVDFQESFGEVSIVLRQPGRSCRVLLVDEQGQPRPRCTLVRGIREEDESRQVTTTTRPDWSAAFAQGIHQSTCEDGSAYFTGLEAGTYRFELPDQPANAVRVKIEDFEPHTATLVCK